MGLSSRFKNGEYPEINLLGLIKEVNDIDDLGVNEFHEKYFNGNPLYLDKNRKFYEALGNRSLLTQLVPSNLHQWIPKSLHVLYFIAVAIISSILPVKSFQYLKDASLRHKNDDIKGNMKGEGFIQGGIMIVHPIKGVIYMHEEVTGAVLPYDEIKTAIDNLKK